jgi:hypothetical protein
MMIQSHHNSQCLEERVHVADVAQALVEPGEERGSVIPNDGAAAKLGEAPTI